MHRPLRPIGLILLLGTLSLDGTAAAQSPSPPASTAPASTTPAAMRSIHATWTAATLPRSPGSQSAPGIDQLADGIWSDGTVALVNGSALRADGSRSRRGIWASLDGGGSWQRTTTLDRAGRVLRSPVGGAFTRAEGFIYAVPVGGLIGGEPAEGPVLRSRDGLHWKVVAAHQRLPDGAAMGPVAATGLIAPGAMRRTDVNGFFQASDLGRPGRVDATPILLGSADGISWGVSARLPLAAGEQGIAERLLVAPDGAMLVLGEVATGWTVPRTVAMWHSRDGITFERVTSGPVATPGVAGGQWHATLAASSGTYARGFYLLTYQESRFPVASTIWTSPDGAAWQAHTLPSAPAIGGAVGVDDDVLGLAVTGADPWADPGLGGLLLTPQGEWRSVPGSPALEPPTAVQTAPRTVAFPVLHGLPDPVSGIVVGRIDPSTSPSPLASVSP